MSMEHTGALALAKMEEELVVYEPTGATHVIPIATGRVSLGRAATNLAAVLGTKLDALGKELSREPSKSSRAAAPALSGQRPVDMLILAGQELAAHRPLSELFTLILDLSIQAVQASRGVLLTMNG